MINHFEEIKIDGKWFANLEGKYFHTYAHSFSNFNINFSMKSGNEFRHMWR